jgi:hypothetical protein
MNLLDTASLVVTPNGYKASKLYSIIPSDGSGDMTFARTGDTATRVNSSGLIETVLANKPRLDYTGVGCPKLLLEPQRTNLVTYSQAFDNVLWAKDNLTVTADATTSPDGTTNADKLIENTTNGSHRTRITAIASSTGTTYTASCFFKASERTSVYMAIFDIVSGDASALFNLSNGTASNTSYGSWTNTSYTITNYGNGWYRCTVTGTQGAGTTARLDIYMANGSAISYAGTTNYGLFAYGAQLEVSTYATSYIPTTTASVTRNQDQCSKSSATALIGQTEGVMFVDYIHKSLGHDRVILEIDNNSSSIIYFYVVGSTNNLLVDVINGGTIQASFSGITLVDGTRYKIAIGYKANDFVLYVNGVQRGSDSSGSVPTLSYVNVGRYLLAGDTYYNQYNSISLWKTRLTNQELVTLTTI